MAEQRQPEPENAAASVAEILRTALRSIEGIEPSSTSVTNGLSRFVATPRPDFGPRPLTTNRQMLDNNRPRPSTGPSSSEAARRDFRNAFPSLAAGGKRPSNPLAKKQKRMFIPPKEIWTRDFVCLAKSSTSFVPTFLQLTELNAAELGKRKVKFPSQNLDHSKVKEVLEGVYPKLESQNGAFELLRAQRGGMNSPLAVIPMSAKGYSLEYIKENVSNNSVIYIRPIQSDLSMSKCSPSDEFGLTTNCHRCSTEVALSSLREHLINCSPGDALLECSTTPKNCSSVSAATSSKKEHINEIEKNWKQQLKLVCSNASDETINDVILVSDSLDEAANRLMDRISQTSATSASLLPSSTFADEKSDTGLTSSIWRPYSLNSFICQYATDTLQNGYEEAILENSSPDSSGTYPEHFSNLCVTESTS
eukprot:gene2787-3227_t